MRLAILFDNLGPYHLARLEAVARDCQLLAIQVHAQSAEYAWHTGRAENAECREKSGMRMVTLLKSVTNQGDSRRELEPRLRRALDEFEPDVVCVPGWSSQAAFVALQWCVRQDVPAISMSESTAWDEQRSAWKEWIKRRIVGLCSAALVGGSPHADYMVALGMPRDRVFLGYDAVDNRYFADKVAEVRGQSSVVRGRYALPEKYFLASARFIEKKNLARLLQAYARYRELVRGLTDKSVVSSPDVPWSLVLLGDGPLRSPLSALRASLGLDGCVLFPGFKQYQELPAYYGLASAFIHPSTSEQWGLVVNEAMASGLPVLVSNRCGCAADLVQEGRNGFTFDPFNTEEMAGRMLKMARLNQSEREELGAESNSIIAAWGPERFSHGLKTAADMAVRVGPKTAGFFDRRLLDILMRR